MNGNFVYAVIFNATTVGDGEFKKYLDEALVLETISAAIVALRLESVWPQNPMLYIRNFLAAHCGAPSDTLAELQEAQAKINNLEKENQEFREIITDIFAAQRENFEIELAGCEKNGIGDEQNC